VRRLTTLLLIALLAAGLGAGKPEAARADGGDNTAVAINTTDGSRLAKIAFAIRHVAGDVVDEQNAAVAYASCTDCQTLAIAIEIVLVEGSPSVVTPTNVAIAINESCTLCTTAALAYQFVVGTGEPVKFTAAGLRELAQIRAELEALRVAFEKGAITLEQLKARVDVLAYRIKHVLETELEPINEPATQNKGPPNVTTTATTTEQTTSVPPTTETASSPTSTTETTETTATTTVPTTTETTTTTTP
jgi:putative peptide zinc metalloprotease protein